MDYLSRIVRDEFEKTRANIEDIILNVRKGSGVVRFSSEGIQYELRFSEDGKAQLTGERKRDIMYRHYAVMDIPVYRFIQDINLFIEELCNRTELHVEELEAREIPRGAKSMIFSEEKGLIVTHYKDGRTEIE